MMWINEAIMQKLDWKLGASYSSIWPSAADTDTGSPKFLNENIWTHMRGAGVMIYTEQYQNQH